MIDLYEYILPEDVTLVCEAATSSNAERKQELIEYLKGKKYEDYVQILNKMLEDPKAKALLEDGFGGELGDTKLKFKEKIIPVRNLRPTQSEIDVNKSVDFPLLHPEMNIDNYYSKGCIINKIPIITFRGNYVIDGHHRWSQVYAFNPDATMTCYDYDGNISPISMLKATQGAIAAVMADDSNNNNGQIPQEKVNGQNLFDTKWDKDAIYKYIIDHARPEVLTYMQKYHNEFNSIEDVAEFVADSLMEMKSNNYPEHGSPSRGDMPQTDKAGSEPGNKQSADPSSPGSALNRLKIGKIVRNSVK